MWYTRHGQKLRKMLAPLVFFLVRRIEAIATTTTRRTAEEVTE